MRLAPFHYDRLRKCFAILSRGLQSSSSNEVQTWGAAENATSNVTTTPVVTPGLQDIQPAHVKMPALSNSVIHHNDSTALNSVINRNSNAAHDTVAGINDISKDVYPNLDHTQATEPASGITLISKTAISQPAFVVDTVQSPEIPKVVSSAEPTENTVKVRHSTLIQNQREILATRFFTNLPWQNNEKPALNDSAYSKSAYVDTAQFSTQNIRTQYPSQKTVLSVAQQSDSDDHENAVLPVNATINNANPVCGATHATALHALHPEPSANSSVIDLSQLATAFFKRLPWQLTLEKTTKITDQSAEPVSFTTSEKAIVFVPTSPTQESISIRAGHELSDKDRAWLESLVPPEHANPVLIATHHALNPVQRPNELFDQLTELSSGSLTTLSCRHFFQMLPWSTQTRMIRNPIFATNP